MLWLEEQRPSETRQTRRSPGSSRPLPALRVRSLETKGWGGRWTVCLSKCFHEKTFSSSNVGLLVLLPLSQQCSLLDREV